MPTRTVALARAISGSHLEEPDRPRAPLSDGPSPAVARGRGRNHEENEDEDDAEHRPAEFHSDIRSFRGSFASRPFPRSSKTKRPRSPEMADGGARDCPRPIHRRSHLAQGRTCVLERVCPGDVSPRLDRLVKDERWEIWPLVAPRRGTTGADFTATWLVSALRVAFGRI